MTYFVGNAINDNWQTTKIPYISMDDIFDNPKKSAKILEDVNALDTYYKEEDIGNWYAEGGNK